MTEIELKKYVAYIGGARVISVGAPDQARAKQAVERQLDRDGRRELLFAWKITGQAIKEEEELK